MRAANHAELAQPNAAAQRIIDWHTGLQHSRGFKHRRLHTAIEPRNQPIVKTAEVKTLIITLSTIPAAPIRGRRHHARKAHHLAHAHRASNSVVPGVHL